MIDRGEISKSSNQIANLDNDLPRLRLDLLLNSHGAGEGLAGCNLMEKHYEAVFKARRRGHHLEATKRTFLRASPVPVIFVSDKAHQSCFGDSVDDRWLIQQ